MAKYNKATLDAIFARLSISCEQTEETLREYCKDLLPKGSSWGGGDNGPAAKAAKAAGRTASVFVGTGKDGRILLKDVRLVLGQTASASPPKALTAEEEEKKAFASPKARMEAKASNLTSKDFSVAERTGAGKFSGKITVADVRKVTGTTKKSPAKGWKSKPAAKYWTSAAAKAEAESEGLCLSRNHKPVKGYPRWFPKGKRTGANGTICMADVRAVIAEEKAKKEASAGDAATDDESSEEEDDDDDSFP